MGYFFEDSVIPPLERNPQGGRHFILPAVLQCTGTLDEETGRFEGPQVLRIGRAEEKDETFGLDVGMWQGDRAYVLVPSFWDEASTAEDVPHFWLSVSEVTSESRPDSGPEKNDDGTERLLGSAHFTAEDRRGRFDQVRTSLRFDLPGAWGEGGEERPTRRYLCRYGVGLVQHKWAWDRDPTRGSRVDPWDQSRPAHWSEHSPWGPWEQRSCPFGDLPHDFEYSLTSETVITINWRFVEDDNFRSDYYQHFYGIERDMDFEVPFTPEEIYWLEKVYPRWLEDYKPKPKWERIDEMADYAELWLPVHPSEVS